MKKILIASLLSCSLLITGFFSGTDAEASSGDSIVSIANQYIGTPYRYGGTTPSGFDCSGFITYVYKQAGLTLPRTSGALYNTGQVVSKSSLQSGDLVFFNTSGKGVSHVGMYVGNNKFIHSANSGVQVTNLSNSYWNQRYIGAKRVAALGKNGWDLSNGKWYFYNNGVMKTGWVYTGNQWYYLQKDGVMQTGWVQSNGDWYFMDASGAMKIKWVRTSGDWYFMDSSGAMETEWVKANGEWYFMDASGAMKTGWVKVNGEWYFMENSGAMKTGWIQDGEKWYFLQSDGSMAANTIIDGYSLGSDGARIVQSESDVVDLNQVENKE